LYGKNIELFGDRKMKKIKFALSLIFIIMLLMSMCPIKATTIERSITIKDDTGDVLKTDEENPVSYYDVDITNITCVQTGRKVDIEFKLAEDGNFKKSLDTIYSAELYTTSDIDFGYYLIMYGAAITEYFEDTESDVIIFSLESIANNKSLDVISESIENNILSVSFNLENSYERVLGLTLIIEKTVGNISYSDQAPDEDVYEDIGSLEITAGEEYILDAGQTVQLQGNLVEGDPSDYEWLWIFEDGSIIIEERTPTHKFNIPGDYLGTLYAYDDEGNWGLDYVTVTVNETSSGNGGGGNNQPGFELIIVIGAIATALVILRRKK
jgi:hypothetical protein